MSKDSTYFYMAPSSLPSGLTNLRLSDFSSQTRVTVVLITPVASVVLLSTELERLIFIFRQHPDKE